MVIDKAVVLWIFLSLALDDDSGLDDAGLARQIKAGNHEAFRHFYERHADAVYHFLLKKGLAPAEAEEVLQQAFVKLWENRAKIREGSTLRSYVFSIAYNQMLNERRKMGRMQSITQNSDDPQEPVSEDGISPEDDTRHRQLMRRLEHAIQKLPEKQQTVFQLCFLQQMSYREAAEIMDITRKTVENQMSRALKKIRNELGEFL